jgi:hypothetical protein
MYCGTISNRNAASAVEENKCLVHVFEVLKDGFFGAGPPSRRRAQNPVSSRSIPWRVKRPWRGEAGYFYQKS